MRNRLIAATAVFALIPASTAFASGSDSTTPDTSTPDTSADTSVATTDPSSGSSATTGPDGTPGSVAPSSTAGETPTPDAGPVAVTIYDDDRMAVATVTALAAEVAWTDYGDDDMPDEGNQYVRVDVLVESQTTGDDEFSINVDHFVLQDEHGMLTRGDNVRTRAQAEADEDAIGDAELAAGQSVEFTITFEIPAAVQPQAVFYLHEDRLYEIHVMDAAMPGA